MAELVGVQIEATATDLTEAQAISEIMARVFGELIINGHTVAMSAYRMDSSERGERINGN